MFRYPGAGSVGSENRAPPGSDDDSPVRLRCRTFAFFHSANARGYRPG